MTIHELHRYDAYFRLKIPPLLWLTMLYGLRHLLALGLDKSVVGGLWSAMLSDWRLVLSDVVVLLVLFSIGHRLPDAQPRMRQLWHAGRWLLVVAYAWALTGFVTLNWPHLAGDTYERSSLALLMVAVDGALLAYLFMNSLVKDLFADFPEPEDRLPAAAKARRDMLGAP